MINAVLYDIVANRPLSFNNEVSETVYPERTNPNYKYFVPFEPFADPNKDQRLYDYQRVETPVNIAHPIYTIYNQWLIEHEYTKRTQQEVFISIENARRVANASLIDNDLYSMSIGIVIKKLNNELLTSEENSILLMAVDIHNKLMQNYTNEINMKAAWVANQNINIDAGWKKK
jgi:hypothetical protein